MARTKKTHRKSTGGKTPNLTAYQLGTNKTVATKKKTAAKKKAKKPSAAKEQTYADPELAKIEQQKRRNIQRHKVWNRTFEEFEFEFRTMTLGRAKEILSALEDEYSLTPDLRMNTATASRFNRLHLNLSSFISHMEEGIESLRRQSEFEVEKVMDFSIRLNDLFACAYIQIKWKPTIEYPDECVEWIPYCNFRSGKLLKEFINDPAQSNHWITSAISNEVLEVDGSIGVNDVDLDSATRFRSNPAVTDLGTTVHEMAILETVGNNLEEGEIAE